MALSSLFLARNSLSKSQDGVRSFSDNGELIGIGPPNVALNGMVLPGAKASEFS
jgi:hypothetical protein